MRKQVLEEINHHIDQLEKLESMAFVTKLPNMAQKYRQDQLVLAELASLLNNKDCEALTLMEEAAIAYTYKLLNLDGKAHA